MNTRQPIISLTHLIKNLSNVIMKYGEVVSAVQQQEQAIIASKAAIDSLDSINSAQFFPLSPNWTVAELTPHVIEEENVNNLYVLIDTINELSTYGATSEFFISTIRLLEQAGLGD